MSKTLIQHAELVATLDDVAGLGTGREIADGALWIVDGVIVEIGTTEDLAHYDDEADRIIEAWHMLLMPGLVNTHHHLFQSLTRAVPVVQNAKLFKWLTGLYPIWESITPEMITASARLALAELVLSGCTTAADHLYLYPPGVKIEDEIEAAVEIGIRFHPTRGSMSVGESQGGLPPDRVVENEETILADSRRVIEDLHDPARFSMCRIAIAPCAPFNVSEDLMRQSAVLARSYGVHLHTHVAETLDEERYTLRKVGMRPVDYMESLGWMGDDVWWAHAVCLDEDEIRRMAETGTGVAHCPGSNMRLGSGIAPVREYIDSDVRVGLAVDGSSSNDSGHLLGEARLAMLLQRVAKGAGAMTAREALGVATWGGARVLGRDDIGRLMPGMAADLIGIRLDTVDLAGAQSDPLAALLFCNPPKVDLSMINGQVVVERGQLLTADLDHLVADQNRLSRKLLET